MTRDDFIKPPGDAQWAITAFPVFRNEYRWGCDKDCDRYRMDELGLAFPDCIDVRWLNSMMDDTKIFFDVYADMNDLNLGWLVF